PKKSGYFLPLSSAFGNPVLGSAAAAWPLAAPAQQAGRMRRVGVLMFGAADDREATAIIAAFMQGLKAIGLGFMPKGQNQCSPRWKQRDNSESDTLTILPLDLGFSGCGETHG